MSVCFHSCILFASYGPHFIEGILRSLLWHQPPAAYCYDGNDETYPHHCGIYKYVVAVSVRWFCDVRNMQWRLCLSDGKRLPQRWKSNASAIEIKCLSDGNRVHQLMHNRRTASIGGKEGQWCRYSESMSASGISDSVLIL